MSKRVVILGGFTTGKRVLEPVADAAMELGLGTDAAVFTFPYAMEYPEGIKRAAKGQLVLTHSAGILAVAEARGMAPEQLVAYNGPEPRRILELTSAANRKLIEVGGAAIFGHNRAQYARVLATNIIQGMTHPYSHLRQTRAVSQFSTFRQLAICHEAGIAVSAAVTEGDVFFPYNPATAPQDIDVRVYSGIHDELLVNPHTLLRDIVNQLDE